MTGNVIQAQDVHSNASNFVSAEVDPRTGKFSVSITFPLGAANSLKGPTPAMTLAYDAQQSTAKGFGTGWQLLMTQWDNTRRVLSLSTGEHFIGVPGAVGEEFGFRDRKLPSFRVFNEGARLVVWHKSGLVEYLARIEGEQFLPVSIRSPEGHAIWFSYTEGGNRRLNRVTDDEGRILLVIDYGSAGASVQLYPEDRSRAAALVMRFILHQGRLQDVYLPDSTEPGFSFGYDLNNPSGLDLLRIVTSPMGGQEWVEYQYDALPMPPGAPLSHMSAVKTLYRVPGHGQPASTSRYVYSSNNAYGYNAVSQWTELEDNLYKVLREYLYSSTEIRYLQGGQEASWTRREFNRFHLMVRERTHSNNHWQETETHYHDLPSGHFQEQPAYFQLPRTVTSRYWTGPADAPERLRERTESYRYDDAGNVVWHRDAAGRVEVEEYFPAAGEEGECPADPLGFVRFVKSTTVTPPPGTQGAVRITRNRYVTLKAADEGADHVVPWSMEEIESDGSVQSLVAERQQRFVQGGEHHGRMAWVQDSYNGLPTRTDYEYELLANAALPMLARSRATLLTRTRVTGFESLTDPQALPQTRTFEEARALIDGQLVLARQEAGATQVMDYDSLGRLVSETAAPGTAYEATVRYTHQVARNGSLQTMIDVGGQVSTVQFDGFGREVRRQGSDLGGELYTTWEADYDALGQLRAVRECEPGVPQADGWLRGLVLETSYVHDDWGNLSQVHRPDGVVAHSDHDPISLQDDSWLQVGSRVTQQRTTRYDLEGRVIEVIQQHEQQPVTVLLQAYDGHGRLTSSTDAEGNTILRGYDAFDREVFSQLPDGAQVRHAYALHERGAAPISVSIEHPSLGLGARVLGTQRYDGLGRMVEQATAGRTKLFAYPAGYKRPTTITLPDGRARVCTYEPILGQALLSDVAIGATAPEDWLIYQYHPLFALPSIVTNELGSQQTEFRPDGLIESQTATYDQVARAHRYEYSASGRLVASTAVDGERRVMSFDALGRLVRVAGTDVEVGYGHDEFSRVNEIVTATLDGQRALAQRVDYDGQGREVLRTLRSRTAAGAATQEQRIEQAYSPSSKLRRRTLVLDGQTLRDEQFQYDARGRLTQHDSTGGEGPVDAQGNRFVQQHFEYDALDNITRLHTQFSDAAANVTSFGYSPVDPTQLLSVRHTRTGPGYQDLDLTYDQAGNLQHDQHGRPLHYDTEGRLTRVGFASGERLYRYDPGQAVGAVVEGGVTHYRYYERGRLTHEFSVSDGAEMIRYAHANGQVVAQSYLAGAVRRTIVLGTDSQGSVLSEVREQVLRHAYNAYGFVAEEGGESLMAFAGERREQGVGWYLLGSYRVYNPVLMRFHSPDAFSPFASGGLNAYAYCAGDPVNRIDPTGTSWLSWLVTGVAVTVGLLTTIATLNPAAGAAAALLAGGALTASAAATIGASGLAIASLATGVAAVTLEAAQLDGKAGAILGYVSLGTGLASAGLAKLAGRAGMSIAKTAEELAEHPKELGKVLDAIGDVYITDNMYDQGKLAYRTHGSKEGFLMSSSGQMVAAEEVADEIASEIALLSPLPAQDAPLTLIACYGASPKVAGVVAEKLGRPVVAYRKTIGSPGLSAMERPEGTWFFPNKGPNYSNNITRSGKRVRARARLAKRAGVPAPPLRKAERVWFYPDNWPGPWD